MSVEPFVPADFSLELAHLGQVNGHIAMARTKLLELVQTMARRENLGLDPMQSQELLNTFKTTLDVLQENRAQLVQTMKLLKPPST